MGWVALVVVVGFTLWTYFNMPKVPKTVQKPGDLQAPICVDGEPLPVVFGTVCLKGANVTWWGGVETQEVKGNGEDKGRLIYFVSMRMVLCHGTIDGILKIFVGEKALQVAPIMTSQRVNVRAYPFFSGGKDTSLIGGSFYVRDGVPNATLGNHSGVQSVPSEINGEPGGLGPGFFGVACVELEHFRVGGSPYLEPWAFVVQRIEERNSPAPFYGIRSQWYRERCYIPHGVTGETKWKWNQGDVGTVPAIPNGNMNTWYQNHLPSDWSAKSLYLPFGQGASPTGLPAVVGGDFNYGWEARSRLWAQTTVYTDPTDAKLAQKLYLFVYCENAAWVWVDDTYVGTTNATNEAKDGSSANFDVTDLLKSGGSHTIVIYATDEYPADETDSTYLYARVVTSPVVDNNVDAATLYSYRDMNPAHIIRECLTDEVWGMGYTDADIDDVSFGTAADTLYRERFGLSLLWSKPGSIDDFLNEVLRHINGTLYIDRSTGRYKLTLVREGYDVNNLLALDESTIERLEDVSRRTTGDLINQVSVSYTSSVFGDEGTVTITEPGLVQSQGAIIPSKIDYPGITTHDLASRVALRDLRTLSTPSLSCTVVASRKASTLNPGDAFVVTWPECGLDHAVMRVAAIDLGDGRSNRVKVKCVEDVFYDPEHNVVAPPTQVWDNPAAAPIAVPDPIFVDTYNYKSTFMPAKLADRALRQSVDAVFCRMVGASGGTLAEIFRPHEGGLWEEIRPGVWRATDVGQAIPEYWLDGVRAFAGMRVLCAFVMQEEYPLADLQPDDKPNAGIYVLTDPGFRWDEATQTYVNTYAQLERAPDFSSGDQLENGCVVAISGGTVNGGKYARLTTAGEIVIGTTPIAFERLNSYSAIRGDNLLTEAQTQTFGDGSGDTLNLSATVADPGVWITFPTLTGTPNAQTYSAGRTRWKLWANFLAGDPGATTTIQCQLVKYVDANNITVLAEAETDPISGGDDVFWGYYITHADMNNDQTLGGARLAVRYRLTTTSAEQVVVKFRYGDMLYITRVDTPLVLGEATGGFPHTPYGEAIALDGDGILTIPDMSLCSGEVRVSGATFKGIAIVDGKGEGFVGGDKLSIRLTTNCHIHHNETVRAGAAGLNLSTSGGLVGDNADKEQAGPRSQIILQYDDLVGQWEVVGTPTIMDPT